MCYSKSQRADDNRRCDAHKFGTLASVEMTSYVGNVPQKFVEQTNKELRNEGKGLPNPSQEEVDQFVSTQAFIGQHDPSIPDNRRKTIVERWRKARNEKPSGGLMHAWKNSLTESVVRYRRTAVASVMAASVLATSACGSTPPRDENPAPAPEVTVTAPANPSENATPTPTESAKPKLEKNKEAEVLEKQGIKLGKTESVEGGSYPTYVVTKESKLGKFNSSTHSGGKPSGWSSQDMEESQLKASNFFVNTVLNNQTRTDYYANIKPLEKTFDKEVLPEYRNQFKETIQSNDTTPLMKDIFADPSGQYADYTLINDGKTPRIKNINIKVSESQEWDGGNYFVYKGDYTLSAINQKTGKARDIDAKVEYGISVDKGKDGKMYISGLQNIQGLYENIK